MVNGSDTKLLQTPVKSTTQQQIDSNQKPTPTVKQQTPQSLPPKRYYRSSYLIMDRNNLRTKIKHRLQLNGYYNFKKQKREQIQQSVHEMETLLQQVVKV